MFSHALAAGALSYALRYTETLCISDTTSPVLGQRRFLSAPVPISKAVDVSFDMDVARAGFLTRSVVLTFLKRPSVQQSIAFHAAPASTHLSYLLSIYFSLLASKTLTHSTTTTERATADNHAR